jgi:hypothetical protein
MKLTPKETARIAHESESKTQFCNIAGKSKDAIAIWETIEKRRAMKPYVFDRWKECAKAVRSIARKRNLRNALPCSTYSMGGETDLMVAGIMTACTIDTRKEYAKRCTWKAQHGWIEIHLNPSEFRRAWNIHSVLTICDNPANLQIGKIVPASWFELQGRKQHEEIERVNGFLVRLSGGNIFHASTQEEAKERLEQERKAQRQAEQKAKEEKQTIKALETLKLSFDDSLKAGNCKAGTLQFIHKHGLSESATYTVKQLIKIGADERERILKIARWKARQAEA